MTKYIKLYSYEYIRTSSEFIAQMSFYYLHRESSSKIKSYYLGNVYEIVVAQKTKNDTILFQVTNNTSTFMIDDCFVEKIISKESHPEEFI